MDNGVEPTAMDESAKRLEDEVRRTVEQAKELRDAASSLVAKSSSEEQSIRQRAASLDSTLRRLRSSIDSQRRLNLLDPHLSDKLDGELQRARCIVVDGDAASFFPSKPQGRFLKMFLGPINVRATRKDVQLKVKEEYNNYRDRTALLFLLFPAVLLILRSWIWKGCMPAFPVQLYQAWLLFLYTGLALRENILRVNGSDIRPWWIYHHYSAMAMALVSLTWEIKGEPDCAQKQRGVQLFLQWAMMQGVAMLLQNRYQRQRLYTRIALGKAKRMDVVWGETAGVAGQIWLLCPILFILQGFEAYVGLSLLKTAFVGVASEWQVIFCSALDLDSRAEIVLEKELMDHKSLRKFSVDMLLSLHNLSSKAGSWARVLEVIEGYINFLVPHKTIQNFDTERPLDMKATILIQSTSQIARVMFESATDVLLFLSYLVHISWQIHMSHEDVSRIQFELFPMLQEIISEWLIIQFFASMPSEPPADEDFSYQLSSLKIDSSINKRSWKERQGKPDFTLAFLLFLNGPSFSEDHDELTQKTIPGPQDILSAARNFISWIIWGRTGEESSLFLSHSAELAMILLRNGQYNAAELLIGLVESHTRKEYTSRSLQDAKGEWCMLHHLLGCSLLAQSRLLRGSVKEAKANDAVRCFFRASSGVCASQALLDLSDETGFPQLGLSYNESPAAWKLHYYQWAMQTFEQHNISEGACQFALAALEQVDEALSSRDSPGESATGIRGRLWANVFKFTLDLNHYDDAYCAIISNPDEESKYICLRRFIIVLYERGALKILCNGQLPLIGLTEKVELELSWKAERSDIMLKQNPYKLLYAFEVHRQNWRRAATYMYRFTSRLRNEVEVTDSKKNSVAIQERLNGLSAAINALHLVHPLHAWIDPLLEEIPTKNEHYPSKRTKTTVGEKTTENGSLPHTQHSYLDIEKLEKEFVLTSAEYLLCLANIKWSYSNASTLPPDLVELLVQMDLYDMAFTALLRFCKDSELKKELERVFRAMSLKCCPNVVGAPLTGNDLRSQRLLLPSSKNEVALPGLLELAAPMNQFKGNSYWENLELYLGKYKNLHARLPVVVAETLLHADSEIELPLWLVHMFKCGGSQRTWGMTGQESSPASLFQLYVDHGRFTEATNLLLEYIDSYKSVRPAEVIFRKRPSSVWFPYTAIERLWCQLERAMASGHMVEQSKRLQSLLHGSLLGHLNQLKVDSDDAVSSLAK